MEVGLPGSCQFLPQLTEDPLLPVGDPVGHHSVQKVKPDADDQPHGYLQMLSDGQSVI